MSIIGRFSNVLSAAKKAWNEPRSENIENAKSAQISGNVTQPVANLYYVDTISKADSDLPKISSVELYLESISNEINEELKQGDQDFDKLQAMIYKVIMLMMRLSAKSDQENIYEISLKIKEKSEEIKKTYNTWQGLVVTVISSGVSIAGGVVGTLAFTLPVSIVAAETAKSMAAASQGISTAGTGIGGLSSIFNNRSEAERGMLQSVQKVFQDNEDERKGSKHSKTDQLKTAKAAAEEFSRSRHEARRTAASAA